MTGRTIQEAMALEDLPLEARAQAARDRNFLARLRALGRVLRRDGAYEARHPEVARDFVSDIERRARAQGLAAAPMQARGMDTIRPNPKNRKKRKR